MKEKIIKQSDNKKMRLSDAAIVLYINDLIPHTQFKKLLKKIWKEEEEAKKEQKQMKPEDEKVKELIRKNAPYMERIILNQNKLKGGIKENGNSRKTRKGSRNKRA